MIECLHELCSIDAVSSYEDEIRAYISEKAQPYADDIKVDSIGNLLIWKRGKKQMTKPLMLIAHMDEVGFMVSSITDEGYLKFVSVGGIDRRVIAGRKVHIGRSKITGVIALKAYHLLTTEERKRVPKWSEFYIDIGANTKEEAEAVVAIGDMVSFVQEPSLFGEGMFRAKAIDDRVGCAVMLSLLEEELPVDCVFVFSVQEEVGTRGAFGSTFSVEPDVALILEGTTSADIPSMKGGRKVCAPGEGPVISYMDGSAIYDRQLFERLRVLANKSDIQWQTKHMVAGGTDAGTVQRTKQGVKVAGISCAVRYLHTACAVASVEDMKKMRQLAYCFIEDMANDGR